MSIDATSRLRVRTALCRMFPAWAGMTKAEIDAAVNATDDWADANAASFNTALPLPFRTTANAAQKALVLAFVCLRRAGVITGVTRLPEDQP